METPIERFFCNVCKGKTKHFIRASHENTENDRKYGTSFIQRMFIAECCGCEHFALVKKTHFSEHVDIIEDPQTGQQFLEALWDEAIYPPVTYRPVPAWFDDLPDPTIRQIFEEIYKSLQTESHYLAAFGSRTLIDRLIVLSVGDKGSFNKGLNSLKHEEKISTHEMDILKPVLEAGHAAAHRGWAPNKEQIAIILDTVEGLVHRLLVLPKLSEELDGAVPLRGTNSTKRTLSQEKVDAAPADLADLYNQLETRLKAMGEDVSIHPQKHYVAFRRNRNFACLQIYNQKRLIRAYLNLNPDQFKGHSANLRDVRQIGHFGTGDLEVTIKTKEDLENISILIEQSYLNS